MIRDEEKEEAHQDCSRREFINTAALLLGGAGALSACGQDSEPDTGLSNEPNEGASEGLSLTASGYKFKRFAALFDGRVKIEGCETRFEARHRKLTDSQGFRKVDKVLTDRRLLGHAGGVWRNKAGRPVASQVWNKNPVSSLN